MLNILQLVASKVKENWKGN